MLFRKADFCLGGVYRLPVCPSKTGAHVSSSPLQTGPDAELPQVKSKGVLTELEGLWLKPKPGAVADGVVLCMEMSSKSVHSTHQHRYLSHLLLSAAPAGQEGELGSSSVCPALVNSFGVCSCSPGACIGPGWALLNLRLQFAIGGDGKRILHCKPWAKIPQREFSPMSQLRATASVGVQMAKYEGSHLGPSDALEPTL